MSYFGDRKFTSACSSSSKSRLNLFSPEDILNAQRRFESIRRECLTNIVTKNCSVVLTRIDKTPENVYRIFDDARKNLNRACIAVDDVIRFNKTPTDANRFVEISEDPNRLAETPEYRLSEMLEVKIPENENRLVDTPEYRLSEMPEYENPFNEEMPTGDNRLVDLLEFENRTLVKMLENKNPLNKMREDENRLVETSEVGIRLKPVQRVYENRLIATPETANRLNGIAVDKNRFLVNGNLFNEIPDDEDHVGRFKSNDSDTDFDRSDNDDSVVDEICLENDADYLKEIGVVKSYRQSDSEDSSSDDIISKLGQSDSPTTTDDDEYSELGQQSSCFERKINDDELDDRLLSEEKLNSAKVKECFVVLAKLDTDIDIDKNVSIFSNKTDDADKVENENTDTILLREEDFSLEPFLESVDPTLALLGLKRNCAICKFNARDDVRKNDICKNLFLCTCCRFPYEYWYAQPWQYVTLHRCNCANNCYNSSCAQCRSIKENWMTLEPWKFTTNICSHDSTKARKFLSECVVCHFWSCVNFVLNEVYCTKAVLSDCQVSADSAGDKDAEESQCKNVDLVAANLIPWLDTMPGLSAIKSNVPIQFTDIANRKAEEEMDDFSTNPLRAWFRKKSRFLKTSPDKFVYDNTSDSDDENEEEENGPRIRYVSRRASIVSGSKTCESSGALSALPNNVKRLIRKLDQRKLENLYTMLREKLPSTSSDDEECVKSRNFNGYSSVVDSGGKNVVKRKHLNGLKASEVAVKKLKLDTSVGEKPKVEKKARLKRCGLCEGCKAENCQTCICCRDMPSNGGKGLIKQVCIERRCIRIMQNRRASGRYT